MGDVCFCDGDAARNVCLQRRSMAMKTRACVRARLVLSLVMNCAGRVVCKGGIYPDTRHTDLSSRMRDRKFPDDVAKNHEK